MTTIVEVTVGTGGDYSTLQAAEDAKPANLVTSDQVYRIKLKNQSFSGTSTRLTIAGSTTDATRYCEVVPEAGAAFNDNGSVRSNALRYNTSNGASIQCTYSGVYTGSPSVVVSENYARLSNLQIAFTGTASANRALDVNATGVFIDRCIIESSGTTAAVSIFGASTIRRSLVLYRGSNASATVISLSNGAHAYNCTFGSTVTTLTNGIGSGYGAGTFKSLVLFGCTNVGTTAGTKSNCYTSATAISGWTNIAYDTSSGTGFENITDSTRDYRIKAGSALIDAGANDSNGTPDISGTTAPQGSGYDVGCWEYAAAAAGVARSLRLNQAVNRASTY